MPTPRSRRVLVAEDDPVLLELTANQLRDSGCVVTAVNNGEAALAEMEQGQHDLLLTDLDMPGMDGCTLIRRIRAMERFADFPIIVVTSSSDALACTQAFHAGATNFTTKPINWALLSGLISYVLRNADREAALREARLAAERATALRDNLMAMVGHELRTPLNAMIGFTNMLRDEVFGPLGSDEYKDYVEEIANAGQRLNGLVSDALLTSRLITGTHSVDISDNDALEVLKPVFADLTLQAKAAHQRLIIHELNADLSLQCDTRLFQSAASHLIRNAIENCPHDTVIDVTCSRRNGQISLCIEDNGPGIPEERLEDLSKPLVQGDDGLTRTSSGLGFGLSIAKAVAELHGGALILANRRSGGLHVDLQLPVYEVSYKSEIVAA